MRVIGHRGCPDHFPENTIAAVRGAAAHVDWVEVDVQRCVTGDVVVFHDDRLDRLTEASGRVRETSLDKLRALTIGESNERIPTLDEVLDAVPADTGLNVELKHIGLAADVEAMVQERPHDTLLSSFDADALASVDTVPTALLFADSYSSHLDQAAELGCAAVHPHRGLVDRDTVAMAHDRSLSVNTWTVQTGSEATRLREAGVDGVIVDSWDVVDG